MKNAGRVINLLKKESAKWKRPFVSQWAEVARNPFTTLVSCVLSLRTKDEVTAQASLRLLKRNNTPEKLLKLTPRQIEKLIYPVGFYRTKAKRIREICKAIVEKHNGKVPTEFGELLKLKGVGKKTASIVMVYGHKKAEYIPVDVHVHVIANRLGWVKTRSPDETMEKLMSIIPKRYWYDLNELFVQFGQNVCLTSSPFCSTCPIRKYCKRAGVKRSR
jgi:endonuclease-3